MKRLFFIGWIVVGLLAGEARAERGSGAAVAATLAADAVRLKAMMAGDAQALADVLSDDLIFVHSDGRSESKKDYVKNVLTGDTAYADAKTYQIETLQNTDSVVVIGVQEMRKKLGPTWSEVKLRFLAVWRNENGTWRMVAWLSAKPTGNSMPPPKS